MFYPKNKIHHRFTRLTHFKTVYSKNQLTELFSTNNSLGICFLQKTVEAWT